MDFGAINMMLYTFDFERLFVRKPVPTFRTAL